MIDNHEVEMIMDKLESLEDEKLAVSLLKQFNEASSIHGKLLMNKDPSLSHEEWKNICDKAKQKLDLIVKKIMDL